MQNALLQTHLYSFFFLYCYLFVHLVLFGIMIYLYRVQIWNKFKMPANSPFLFSIAVGVLSFWLTFHRQFILLHRFSNWPKRALTSRFLISLLNYCRVPTEYFVELLRKALEDVNKARHKPRDSLEGRFITTCLYYKDRSYTVWVSGQMVTFQLFCHWII